MAGDEYDRLRRTYCHERNVYSMGDPAVVAPLAFLRIDWTFMTAEEARAWEERNTGPKGGRKYRRCRVCAPTP